MVTDGLVARTEPITAPAPMSSGAIRRRMVLAATIGNTLEWYDFLAYSFLSLTIAKLFFPTGDELSSVLLAVATFGIGLVMRPVGGLLLGIYADRVGRKAALTLTIFIMALGTGLIAIAPTYATIGIWAPLLVVISRLLQGFSCGGELGGATAILVESAPEGRRGLYASWQLTSQAAGFLLGAAVTMAVSLSMTSAQLEAGGWRLPFLLGLLITPVGLYIRSKLDEPEPFLRARQAVPAFLFSNALRSHGRSLLTGIGVAVLFVVSAYILFLYMPTYAVRQLQLPFSQALLASTLAGCVLLVCSPIFGAISDRLGRKPLLVAAALTLALLTYPAFMLFAVLMAMYSSPAISVLAELFPTPLRSTAVALTYNLTVAVVSGTAQVIVTWLIAATGSPLAPAFYVIGAALISTASAMAIRDRFREPLH